MSKLIDVMGERYNRLTVIERAENAPNGIPRWKCLCDCGNVTVVRGQNLKSGQVKSCGCARKEAHNKTHDMSKTKLYHIWANIKNRCNNKRGARYRDYGGRGIKVCDEWEKSFEVFRDWAIQAGYEDGLTIERIDNNCDYYPGNCTWIQLSEQSKNRRSVRMITYNGKTQSIADWCKEMGLKYDLVLQRINKSGWTFERAISEPVHVEKQNRKGD